MNSDTPQNKIGVVLINVGTPDAPETPEVRRYLREFLSDPRVLDMNPVARWLLLNLVILPRRPAQSAEAYRKVWTDEGSPLTVFGQAFAKGLQSALGPDFTVILGHRYGNPSMQAALESLRVQGIDRIVAFPLYPQYAASSTGTSVERLYELIADRWNVPSFCVVPAFYDHPGFIGAFRVVGAEVLADFQPDHVLFSFHGLPERHMRKSDEVGDHCLASSTCCDAIGLANRNCYRAQCMSTARNLAAALEFEPDGWTVSFQSRLGKDPWIKPYTDHVVVDLAKRGVKKLAVFCPAFVADCLETLEEIGMRANEDFVAAGGQALELVPSLNAHPAWVSAAADMIQGAIFPTQQSEEITESAPDPSARPGA